MWLFAHYVWKSVEICPNPKGQSIWLIVITKLGCENKIMLDRPLLIIAIIAIAIAIAIALCLHRGDWKYPLWILRHLVLINTRLADFNQFIQLTNSAFYKKNPNEKNNNKCIKEEILF